MVLYKASHLGFILRFFGTATMTELESLIDELNSAGFQHGKVFDYRNYTFGSFYGVAYDHAEDDEILYIEIEAGRHAETMVEIDSLNPTKLVYKDIEAEKARLTTSGYDVYEMDKADFLKNYKYSRIFK